MVANSNSPFGFRYIETKDGVPPNFGNRTGKIAQANTNATFTGDVLKPLAAGYLDVFTAPTGGGAPVGGIAQSFSWQSESQNKMVMQNWWPGNGDALGDVLCAYYADTGARFAVQALLGPITQADVGLNANFDVGAGGQTFGAGNKSSFSLTAVGSGASLPFKIYGLGDASITTNPYYVQPGYDPSTPYNIVQVTFNSLTA